MHFQDPLRPALQLTLDVYRPTPGDHLCSLWTSPSADRRAGEAFLRAVPDGESSVWILDRSRGIEPGPAANALTGGAAISRYTTDQAHLVTGAFDPEDMRQFWRDRTAEARAAGVSHLRAVAEMAWALRRLPGTDEAPAFESSLNPLLTALETSVICQYGSAQFDAETLLAMILSHPLVVIEDSVFSNPFYVDDGHFSERFAPLRPNAAGSLVPICRHFAQRMRSGAALARLLCNALPSLTGARWVWVQLSGHDDLLSLDAMKDIEERLAPEAARAVSLNDYGRLLAIWPGTGTALGGTVRSGVVGLRHVLEAVYDPGDARLLVARTSPFHTGEVSRFRMIASTVSSLLARRLHW